jgi:hypothetical protein
MAGFLIFKILESLQVPMSQSVEIVKFFTNQGSLTSRKPSGILYISKQVQGIKDFKMTNRSHGFGATQNKGFYTTFENGWSISVQWGPGNYCDRHSIGNYNAPMETDNGAWTSDTAEIAIIHDETETWYSFGNDTVLGHQTPDEVANWIGEVSRWPKDSYVDKKVHRIET